MFLSLWNTLSVEKLVLPLHHRTKHLYASLSFECSDLKSLKERAIHLDPKCIVIDEEEDCVIEGLETDVDALFHLSFSGKSTAKLRSNVVDTKSLRAIARMLLLGKIAQLPPLFVLKESPDIGAHLGVWSKHLVDAPLFADLPTDLARSTTHNKFDPLECLLFPGSGLNLSAVELSVMLGFVMRQHCVRQDSLLIGHVVEPLDEATIGCRTNVVPILIRGSSFDSALAEAKDALETLPPVPFAVLAAALDPEGCAATSSRTALVQICASLVHDSFPQETDERCNAAASVCSCELSVQVYSDGRVAWFFDSELFLPSTVRVYHDHLVAFAQSKGKYFMSPAEFVFVSKGFCGLEVPMPSKCEMHEQFLARCQSSPKAPAVWEAGSEISYSQLLERACGVAASLENASDRVGVLLARSTSCVVAQLSILWSGRVFVPIDPLYPADRIEFILQDAACSVCLVHKHTRHLIPASFQGHVIDVDDAFRKAVDVLATRVERKGDDLCYIMYTSGTTGKPKGVRVMHKGVVNYELCWQRLTKCSPRDRCLWFSGVAFGLFCFVLVSVFVLFSLV